MSGIENVVGEQNADRTTETVGRQAVAEQAAGESTQQAEQLRLPKRGRPHLGKRPEVNAFDLVEQMPGASCECSPQERMDFEARSVQVWRQQERRIEKQSEARKKTHQLKAETEVELLAEMFPLLEKALLLTSYVDFDMDLEKTCEQLMALSAATENAASGSSATGGTSSGAAATRCGGVPEDIVEEVTLVDLDQNEDVVMREAAGEKSRRSRNMIREDEKGWPVLTNSAGWEVCNLAALEEMCVETPREWSQMAKNAQSLPRPETEQTSNKGSPRRCKPEKTGKSGFPADWITDVEDGESPQQHIEDFDLRRHIAHKKRGAKKCGALLEKECGQTGSPGRISGTQPPETNTKLQ